MSALMSRLEPSATSNLRLSLLGSVLALLTVSFLPKASEAAWLRTSVYFWASSSSLTPVTTSPFLTMEYLLVSILLGSP